LKSVKREYYIKNTIEFGWNRNVLTHHIQTKRFDRDDKTKKINNFEATLKNELSELATDIVKSEYNLEFLGISDDMHEREVENSFSRKYKKVFT
jgi:predicted nuclease of restriction endonuclease-like (RecB) superfamily